MNADFFFVLFRFSLLLLSPTLSPDNGFGEPRQRFAERETSSNGQLYAINDFAPILIVGSQLTG